MKDWVQYVQNRKSGEQYLREKMPDHPNAAHATLLRARPIAQGHGLNYVYVGTVHDAEGSSTNCAGCGACLIERDWYQLGACALADTGRCRRYGD